MGKRTALFAVALLGACTASRTHAPVDAGSAEVQPNDNRIAAGRLRDGVLTLELAIGSGTWYAERALPPYHVLAFAEGDGPLQTPGPLIRVRVGTTVAVTLVNRTDAELSVHGLGRRDESASPLRVPAHGRAAAHFRADAAGTYYYWGTLGSALNKREGDDSQLTGALVVDPPGAAQDDRIFVIGRHGAASEGFGSGDAVGAWAINGRSWPDTERLTYTAGETVNWRWINATGHHHPMHLHGAYFRVTSTGDNTHDVPRAPAEQYSVVTEPMAPGGTMALTWTPVTPGNWLFHCHILFHVMPENRLPEPHWYDDYASLPHDQHMAGLALGLTIAAKATGDAAPDHAAPRRIALRAGERPGVEYRTEGMSGPGLGYGVDGGPLTVPGATLVLERGRPVEITIRNEMAHPTSVHWHGIELESYYDGVPHWGSGPLGLTPYIEPGGAFVARFTPPRAGTFIYHTHFNDYVQLSSGLYGGLIVVEPGQTFPTGFDHLFVLSQGGLDIDKDPLLLNGAVEVPALHYRAGHKQRMRFIGITTADSPHVRLMRQGETVSWRALAKDGADLPASAATLRPAEFDLFPGETHDFEFESGAPGELELEAKLGDAPTQRASARVIIDP